MNSSTRLYERLGQIPQDPEDPESLEELIVCAVGAFERYYVCWKNRAGEYKQDGYDLPLELQEWLFPNDGSTRDFATLQVVFGRGDEFFASDRDGKLEYKEPEKKPLPPPPPDEIEEQPVLKRSRTISIFRPLPDPKQTTPSAETSPLPTRRSSNASQSSRPPSMSFSARSMSDASLSSQPASRPPSTIFSRPTSESSFVSHPSVTTIESSRPPSDPDVKPIDTAVETVYEEPQIASPVTVPLRLTRRSRPLSMSFNSGPFPRIPEGKKLLPPEPTPPPLPVQHPSHCTCGCHTTHIRRPTYADASVQTSPLPSPPRTALRIDTTAASYPPFYSNNLSASQDIQTPIEVDFYGRPVLSKPVFMGRMLDYFAKPGYQLGDGLLGGYYGYQQQVYEEPGYQEPVFEYRDEFGELAGWERANGRG